MNDSKNGLTSSVWTNVEANASSSEELVLKFVNKLETGTVFLNRCDYLDPALLWVGVKDSGRGVSLSKFGESVYSQKTISLLFGWLMVMLGVLQDMTS
jgi:acyl-CoA reductase-like NAD-dependent aldehyde dehydrogenase